MSIWRKIFGRWNGMPWQKPKRLDQTNPCAQATVVKWHAEQLAKRVTAGYVFFFQDQRHWEPIKTKAERWHAAGTYIDQEGNFHIYDVLEKTKITLSDTEASEAQYHYIQP